ncbi:MAG: glycoside hydrolase family 5 protein [Oscillospiraceae bacterium]|nr:glycoside hydrolase family 5 protein [Oscillospiraceae bacterium]
MIRNRHLAAFAVMLMAVSSTACNYMGQPMETTRAITQPHPETTTAEETIASPTAAPTETTEAAEETEPAADGPSAKDKKPPVDTASMTALELSKLMGNGIDLGNTHEAYGHGSHPYGTEPTVFEGLWGQPVTTPQIIQGMKDAGFDCVRVPVAWTNAMDYESGDYTIDPAFLDRIEEVIGYCIDADMYVIVNDHWDGSWWGMFGSADQATRDKAMDMYVSMWTQIADRYKDYSDYLIFESANEELGDRLNDKDVAKDSGALSTAECYETTNLINQTFVDTVRAQGGNNDKRFLLIAGYNTDIGRTCNSAYKMPTDTADHKLFVSVHYYTPSDYCLFGSVSHWGNTRQYEEMDTNLEMMTKFTEQGYGVIIGEYGVLTGGGSTPREDWQLWFDNFIANCDLYNYVPVLWDCNDLYNKSKCEIADPDVKEFFLSHSNAAREGMSDEDISAQAMEIMEDGLEKSAKRVADADDIPYSDDTSVAWIMYQSADWSIAYSVGDKYDPTAKADGTKATNALITGPGEYTIGLDFTEAGKPKGIAFSAIGISNGEQFYPNSVIDIKSVKINGEETAFEGKPYTSSDDGKCTRVNLYNGWVGKVPDSARTADGSIDGITATPLIVNEKTTIKTIEITFELIVK